MSTLSLSLVHLQIQPEEKEKENIGGDVGEVVVKESRKVWKNFNVKMMKMGIIRETMNAQILVAN